MSDTDFGKVAEQRLKSWLDRPEDGYSMDRIPDQLSGYYMVSRNICDFVCYKYPNNWYMESKATYADSFKFNQLTNTQRDGLLLKSQIEGCRGVVVVLYAAYQRAFIFNIKDIAEFINPSTTLADLSDSFRKGVIISQLKVKSLNIKKIDKWEIPYWEIQTVPSRKQLLEYTGDLPNL